MIIESLSSERWFHNSMGSCEAASAGQSGDNVAEKIAVAGGICLINFEPKYPGHCHQELAGAAARPARFPI
jgi:hypothetical protein